MQWQECACGSQQLLTVIRDQALAGSEQQMNLAATRLDQLDRPCVCDALRGLAVDLHNLISNLRRRHFFLQFTSKWLFRIWGGGEQRETQMR